MRSSSVAPVLFALSSVAGCSSSNPAISKVVDAGASGAPFAFTEHVAAGQELYTCSYFVPTASDATLVSASHTASAATHHLLVFRTDLASLPAGDSGPTDCFAGDSSPTSHMRGEIYGSQARSASFAFPPGVGLPLRGGEVLLVQFHWLNAGATDVDASVQLNLSITATAPVTKAGVFFFDDPVVDIPPGPVARAAMSCLVPADVTLVGASAFVFAHGNGVSAFVDPPAGPPAGTPFYVSLGAANPLPLQGDVPVAAGSHLRFVCDYASAPGTGEIFQGLDDATDEMCVLSGTYYPAQAPAFEDCALAPGGFGTGSATCAQTLSCVAACGPGTAPPADLGLSTTPAVDPCWQRCVAASCADASALLFALQQCAAESCADDCADPSGDACAACQAAQCPTEWSACASDACSA